MPGKVELYGTTGSVTLQPPDNGSNVTLTLPGSTGTVALTTGAGLQFITSQDFSAVSSVSVNNCFTSTYENYRIILSSKNTATLETRFRFRAAGTDNTALTYTWSAVGGSLASASTLYVTRANGGDYFPIIQAAAADAPNHVSMDLHGPALSTTRHGVTAQIFDGPGVIVYSGGGGQYSAAAFDGFTIYTSTSTITGTVRVYGYRNS